MPSRGDLRVHSANRALPRRPLQKQAVCENVLSRQPCAAARQPAVSQSLAGARPDLRCSGPPRARAISTLASREDRSKAA
jgi:hypothetical protein